MGPTGEFLETPENGSIATCMGNLTSWDYFVHDIMGYGSGDGEFSVGY
jgi:hypothetical protein